MLLYGSICKSVVKKTPLYEEFLLFFFYRSFRQANPPIKSITKMIDKRFKFFSIKVFIGSP